MGRYHCIMKIDLDPENIQVAMDMWRKATDMEILLAPELCSHFFTRRGSILEGFVKTANNWIMQLNGCDATGDDLVALDALRKEITVFKCWAESGIDELAKLAAEVNSGKG
jgi:hypothetical protein